jgi:hypothetical protein
MNHLHRRLGVLWFGVLIFLPACGSDVTGISNTDVAAAESFRFSFGREGRSGFLLEGVNGEVVLVGTSEDSVIVWGERRVESESLSDAEARLPGLQVDATASEDQVLIQTVQPSNAQGRNYVVDYTVELPRDLVVQVAAVNGTISADDIGASSLRLSVVNGLILASIALPFQAEAFLSTVNGNIDLSIPVGTSAELDASVVNGAVSLSGLSSEDLVVNPRSVRGTLGDGDGSLTLSTVNGTIAIRVR